MYTIPTCKEVLAKALLEILGFILLISPMAYVYVFASQFHPYQRGFFCNDQNLKHPYLPQTVPIVQCVLIWAAASTFFIIVVETLRARAEEQAGERRNKPFPKNRTPWIAVELYRYFGYFSLGALLCLLFTELSKYTIGRLRPHYLTLCRPKLSPELCQDDFGYEKFVTGNEEDICEGLISGDVTKKQLNEARLSFLSGHSSFSFYCGMFLIIYLQARLSNFPRHQSTPVRVVFRILKVLRPFIQFSMIILSFWISLTRISDYFHHPLDVFIGAIVGMGFAMITLMVIADVFNKRSAFWKSLGKEDSNFAQENPSVRLPIPSHSNSTHSRNPHERFQIHDNSITMEDNHHVLKTKM
jgi:phosphatidate phosphatase